MTHRFLSRGTPLSHFSANGEAHGFQLLIRVVMVNDDGKLTFPTRELWGKVNGDAATGELEFLLNQINNPDDDDEETIETLAEANDAITGRNWLFSLNPRSPFGVAGTGDCYVTALVKAEPCIWEKVDSEGGGGYYKLHEKNLRTWLKSDGDGAAEFDDEEDCACIPCNSDDESAERDNGDDDDQDDEEQEEEGEEEQEEEGEEDGDENDDNDNGDEQPSGPDQDDQLPDGDDGEEPSESVDENHTSAEVGDDESSKHVDKVQILDDDDLDDDTEGGGVRLSPDQMKPARMLNFTLVGCEAEAVDAGYDGDA